MLEPNTTSGGIHYGQFYTALPQMYDLLYSKHYNYFEHKLYSKILSVLYTLNSGFVIGPYLLVDNCVNVDLLYYNLSVNHQLIFLSSI